MIGALYDAIAANDLLESQIQLPRAPVMNSQTGGGRYTSLAHNGLALVIINTPLDPVGALLHCFLVAGSERSPIILAPSAS